MTINLSMGQRLQITRMHAEGKTWEQIAARLGISAYAARGAVDPAYKQRRAEIVWQARERARERAKRPAQEREREQRKSILPRRSLIPQDEIESRSTIPADVMADRERRMTLAPRSLSAAQFGDPLPGYSALDRRRV